MRERRINSLLFCLVAVVGSGALSAGDRRVTTIIITVGAVLVAVLPWLLRRREPRAAG